jgi:glycosyltransferase involved in cell wall biosynthesis
VHLSLHDIEAAIANIIRSGSRYLLTTTFPSRDTNHDIETGQWRPLNLERPPFSFPAPIRLIDEHCGEWGGQWADKCLGLWEVQALTQDPAHRTAESSSSIAGHTPRVSVIIPTYNRANYIGQAVASALGQTYRDIEVVVVDDGSTDATAEVLGSFMDSRLVRIQQENAGRSRARNVAINAARGEYITFLDSDDYYLPSKIELQVSYLNANPDVGMVYTSAACIDDDGQSLSHTYRALLSGWIYPSIAFFIPHTITLPTVMVRREVLSTVGPFDENLERFEDTDMWRRVAKRVSVAGIDEITCHVRTHSGNRLESLDPTKIVAALDRYIAKVLAEDTDVEQSILQAGARRLSEHYGTAMLNVPDFAATGEQLLRKGVAYFEPMVSVVVPVYNGANYLGAAIESILRQTYPNFEIVVVNDGSNDNGATERVALSYENRIKYFSKSNGGVASALNSAIREARGEYISWLSHDDLYIPDKLERQISFLAQQPEPGQCVVYGDYAVFSQDSDPGTPVGLPNIEPEDFRYFITTQNILHGCTLLIPKAAFERHGWFNENLRTTQDYDLWFRMAKTERFIHFPGVVVLARSHGEQGTLRMIDVMMTEADQLLTHFVESLTLDQIERGASCSAIQGYVEIAESLHKRNFRKAEARSMELANSIADSVTQYIDRVQTREPDETTDAVVIHMLKREISAGNKLRRDYVSLRTRCDEIAVQLGSVRDAHARDLAAHAQERGILASEVAAMHRKLEDVYASSSWRLTRPLRNLRDGLAVVLARGPRLPWNTRG